MCAVKAASPTPAPTLAHFLGFCRQKAPIVLSCRLENLALASAALPPKRLPASTMSSAAPPARLPAVVAASATSSAARPARLPAVAAASVRFLEAALAVSRCLRASWLTSTVPRVALLPMVAARPPEAAALAAPRPVCFARLLNMECASCGPLK